jgi:GNAT superfamily N-acetyltransferase
MPEFSLLIRDGIASDIEACLALDHSYESDAVWQMSLQPDASGWHISFRSERLPRTIHATYAPQVARFERALLDDQCLLVATTREENPQLIGYLTLHYQSAEGIALVQDVVVTRPYRGVGIGKRLVNVARRWANEKSARVLMMEVQTRNMPGIQFCQSMGLTFCGFNDHYFPHHEIAVFFAQPLR